MKYMGLAKLKVEGQTISFDDIIRDIDSVLERCSKRTPKYVIQTLKAARSEIETLRKVDIETRLKAAING